MSRRSSHAVRSRASDPPQTPSETPVAPTTPKEAPAQSPNEQPPNPPQELPDPAPTALSEQDEKRGAQTNGTRLQTVSPYTRRREQEPAAAPFDTDGEAGSGTGRYAGAPLAHDENGPIDPVQGVAQAHPEGTPNPADGHYDGEVRAGPGDAGRQDVPERLPATRPRRPGERARGVALAIFILGVLVAITMWLGAA